MTKDQALNQINDIWQEIEKITATTPREAQLKRALKQIGDVLNETNQEENPQQRPLRFESAW